jgi:hypothetical protein
MLTNYAMKSCHFLRKEVRDITYFVIFFIFQQVACQRCLNCKSCSAQMAAGEVHQM